MIGWTMEPAREHGGGAWDASPLKHGDFEMTILLLIGIVLGLWFLAGVVGSAWSSIMDGGNDA